MWKRLLSVSPNLGTLCQIGTVVLILQMRKLKFRKVTTLASGCKLANGGARI